MKTGLVSIIMPLYNGEKFLDAAVESVRCQTYPNWQLFIVDDGSVDSSLQKAKAWEQNDSRIKVLQHPGGINRGVSASRNLAMKNSSGAYLALLDCDDRWMPKKLERQMDSFEAFPEAGLIYSLAKTIDEEGKPILTDTTQYAKRPPVFGEGTKYNVPFNAFEAQFVAVKLWIPTSSAIFRKAAIKDCLFVENLPYQFEDLLFFLTLAKDHYFIFCEDILIQYRVHGEQWNAKVDREIGIQSSLLVDLLLIPELNKAQCRIVEKRLVIAFRSLCAHHSFKSGEPGSFSVKCRPFLQEIAGSKHISRKAKLQCRLAYFILYGYSKIIKR